MNCKVCSGLHISTKHSSFCVFISSVGHFKGYQTFILDFDRTHFGMLFAQHLFGLVLRRSTFYYGLYHDSRAMEVLLT